MLTARVYDAGIDEPKSFAFVHSRSINAHNSVGIGFV